MASVPTADSDSHSDSDSDSGVGRTLVLEFGSDTTHAGFAGTQKPSVTMPSAVGRPRDPGAPETESAVDSKGKEGETSSEKLQAVYFGDEALSRRGVLRVKRPMEWGLVTNWEDFQALWQHVVENRLGSDAAEHTPVLMVEGETMNPKANRERVTQLAFETFSLPAFYYAPSPPLVLAATGHRTTGLVVDIAGSVVRAVPVYEGYRLPHAIMKFPFSSDDCSHYLHRLLTDQGAPLPFTLNAMKEVRQMKEQLAYVAQDFELEKSTFSVTQEKQYQLSTGETLTLGPERFQCVEPLFRPGLIGMEMWGLAEHVVNTVKRCNLDIRQELLSNVVLAGGGLCCQDWPRLQREVERELLSVPDLRKLHVQVLAPPDGDLLAWKGASLIASTSSFLKVCISSSDYDEYGPSVVHRKCF